jgi:hypothetical protein
MSLIKLGISPLGSMSDPFLLIRRLILTPMFHFPYPLKLGGARSSIFIFCMSTGRLEKSIVVHYRCHITTTPVTINTKQFSHHICSIACGLGL